MQDCFPLRYSNNNSSSTRCDLRAVLASPLSAHTSADQLHARAPPGRTRSSVDNERSNTARSRIWTVGKHGLKPAVNSSGEVLGVPDRIDHKHGGELVAVFCGR